MNVFNFVVCTVLTVLVSAAASAADFCASDTQAEQVRAFYAERPGTQPVIAARRLALPEAVVLSALDESQAAGTSAEAFTEVWAAMTEWQQATFLIMKGANVFEILSGVGQGTPSKTSQYFNIEYIEPMRGHLRPDLYASIYAVAIPAQEDIVSRGIVFLDDEGASVFAAFISGESMDTGPAEIAKFDELMAMIRQRPAICP